MTGKLSVHDRLAKSLMNNPKVAEEFFRETLPENLRDTLDFSTLQLKPDSFIDDSLRLKETDLLFSADFNHKPGFIYLLFEHASSPQKLLPFRMLKYMIAIMDNHLKTKQTQVLPLVYPIILYNGERPYSYSMDLFDLFQDGEKELAKEILTSPYRLIDLTQVPDDELQKFLYFGTMAMTLKHIRDKEILPFFKVLIRPLKELEKQNETSYIYSVMTYISKAGKTKQPREMERTIHQSGLENKEQIMGTLAEYWKEDIIKMIEEKEAAKVTAKVTAEVTEQVTAEVTEQVTAEVTEQVTAEVTEQVTEQTTLEIAKAFFAQGVNIETIAAATTLSRETLKEILRTAA